MGALLTTATLATLRGRAGGAGCQGGGHSGSLSVSEWE